MANHNFSFPVDSFGNMQQNMSQHLQPQQPIAGVPDAYTHGWSEVSEQFRLSNGAVGGPQAPPGAHQMNQQHQGMPQNMSLMGNQALAAQMQRQTPQMQHTVMNAQNQYQQQQQQQQAQQHRLQFNQSNLMGNMGVNSNVSAAAAAHLMQGRQNPSLFPPNPTNINPAVAAQLHKINNGIAPGQAQLQRPSVSNQGNALQQSSAQWGQFEQRMEAIQGQARLAAQNGNAMQMRQARDAAAEVQKKSNEERERWMGVFQQVRANGTNDNAAKQVETWFARYQSLYERSDRVVKSLEQAMQNANAQQNAQQQQQLQQLQQNATNATMAFAAHNNRPGGNGMNPGTSGINIGNSGMNTGMTPQQQWSGLQRDPVNQGAIHGQASFATQPQNHPALSAMNYGSNSPFQTAANGNPAFPNAASRTDAPDPNSFQNRPQVGLNQMSTAQSEQTGAGKENFMRFLSTQNVDSTVMVAGRSIDLWDLWHAVRKFDTTPGQSTNHPGKFHMIAAQLGLPIDSQTGHLYAKELQDHHTRVAMAVQNARPRPTALPPPTHQSAQMNTMMLQNAIKNNPHVDFSGITPDIVANLPLPRFDQRIKAYIAERNVNNSNAVGGNTPHMPPRTPVPGQAMVTNPRIPTPVNNDPNNNGQMSRLNQAFTLNTEEILRLHEQCQTVWRRSYDSMTLPHFPMPLNPQLWKDRYQQAMQCMKPLIMGMGLYLHFYRDKEEMHTIIQKSVLLLKQRLLMSHQVVLTIHSLEDIINFSRPRMQAFHERITMLPSIPPALQHLTKPSDDDFLTLGGLLPRAQPQASTPAGRITPAPPVAMATPPAPYLAGPANLAAARGRRNGFSDAAGNSSSPSFQTSPAVVPNSTSPAASSPPKTAKATRPRPGQKRKQSKAANEPTPATEPASTPTPAAAPTPATGGVKRPYDDAETPAPQAGPPQSKRVKTEPSPPPPPPPPPKPVTPPPQISAPIDRAEIRTADDAKELLVETFKKAEAQETVLQSQGQSSDDLMQWLSQLISGNTDPGPSTPANDLGSLVVLTNEADSQVDGADIEFFDFNAYYPDADVPTVPELDKRATLSPESHNDATTTPPSQTSAPARAGAKPGEQTAAVNGAPLATAVKVESVQIGTHAESELRYSEWPSFLASFSYDGPVGQLDEPWAIA